ncbi:MAG: fibronectin type III domain-containing protein [candidate division KSB1 bacterium]|nr:fibronectin type III domain-containing protein [candidate division KSB1 bacterium]
MARRSTRALGGAVVGCLCFGIWFCALGQQAHKSHEIGRLWETLTPVWSFPEYNPVSDQMCYPGGDFFFQMRKNLERRGIWIGVKDWTNKDGQFKPFYVSEGGYMNHEAPGILFPIRSRKYVRNRLPIVMVNGVQETRLLDSRAGSTRRTTLEADEQIEVTWTTDVGIQVTLNSYAFANRLHDSYIILDFTFKNTGNADQNTNTIELPNQNLHGVYFGFWFKFIPSGDMGHQQVREFDDWVHYVGNQPGDTLRGLWYCYDGDSQRDPRDDIGDPDLTTGEFLAVPYLGVGVLHADRAADDVSDDRAQPITVAYRTPRTIRSHLKGDDEFTLYTELSSGEQSRGTDTGEWAHPWMEPIQEPVVLLAFGPYEIPFGQDVRIVLYEVAGALDQQLAVQFGQDWKAGRLQWRGLTGDQAKNALVATGLDSLLQFASRAQRTWQLGLASVPDGPPAPNLNIDAGPGKVTLRWDPVHAEPDPDTGELDFAGYIVYRTEDRYTMPYRPIWRCGGDTGIPDTTTTFVDRNVTRGRNYYYYVVAYDRYGNASSHYYNRNYQYAAVPLDAPHKNLDSIYVVPNPFHAQGLAYGGTIQEDYTEIPRKEDQIMFVGLPARAVIRIFTVHGDLVAVLRHPNPDDPRSVPGSADEAWFQISSSWQTIKSGVYFYHVEGWDEEGKPLGTATGKFVVIR